MNSFILRLNFLEIRMADNNNFDPCECINHPTAAMMRLLNLVR